MDNDYRQRSGLAKIQPLQAGGQPLRQPLKGDDMGRRKKRLKQKLFAIGIAVFVVVFFIIVPVIKIRSHIKPVTESAKALKYVFSLNDMDQVEAKMADFSKTYDSFENDAKGIYWLSFIPYVSDFKNAVEAGHFSIAAGKDGIKSIAPYADLIGFKKGGSSFSEKSAEDRLQTAVLTLDKVLGNIDKISENIKQAETRIEKIDPNRYPDSFGNMKVRASVISVKEQFHGVSSLFVDAKPLLKQLPKILGKDKEKTYLILFQNNYERRATGGFLTSYAYFRIKNGKMEIEKSSDIYSLDESISSHPVAPKEILTYHKGVNNFYIRDSNLSPDLPTSIKIFESLYSRSGNQQNYDGVIMLDAKVLVDMLTIFGDTEVSGVTFSANKDSRCDCPQVIYTLFDIVDRPVNYIKTDRKGILGDLMFALFNKAIGFSPSKYWGTLAQTMFGNLEQKHILLYFKDKNLQMAAEQINFAGRVKTTDGDYLHINNVNFAGAKSNLYVSETIESKTTKASSGEIQREVVIIYKNPYAHSDCNLERGGLCLNAVLRNWLRVYVPKGSKLVSFKGSQKTVKTYDSLGKTVFEGFMTVSPEGRAQVTVTYTLPNSIKAKDYSLMVQKQPGVEDKQDVSITVAGQKMYDGLFDTDKQYTKSF